MLKKMQECLYSMKLRQKFGDLAFATKVSLAFGFFQKIQRSKSLLVAHLSSYMFKVSLEEVQPRGTTEGRNDVTSTYELSLEYKRPKSAAQVFYRKQRFLGGSVEPDQLNRIG